MLTAWRRWIGLNKTVDAFRDGPRAGRVDPCGSAEGIAAGTSRAQTVLLAISGDGLRRSAETSAERDLVARFEFTSFQRGIGALYYCEHAASPAVAQWFQNAVCGIGVGVSEGVVLCSRGVNVADWAHEIAAENRCSILRLATAVEGELPGEATSQVESLGGSSHRTVTRVRVKLREVLRLAPSYEDTLAALGRHTRRNVRNARKIATSERIAFEFHEGAAPIPDGVLRALARKTEPHPVHGRRMRVFEAYANQTGRAFRSALRTADGEVISYCCGFFGQSAAYLVYQLNDRELNRIGPSLMHRAFLVEALVEQSCRELIFVHGCSGILRHSCVPMVADHYWVMRRTPAARLRAGVLANAQPNHLLGKIARAALQAT